MQKCVVVVGCSRKALIRPNGATLQEHPQVQGSGLHSALARTNGAVQWRAGGLGGGWRARRLAPHPLGSRPWAPLGCLDAV